MKQILLIFSVLITQLSIAQANDHFVTSYQEDTKVLWIDVRTNDEFKEGTIGNAINLDFYKDDFKTEVEKLDKEQEIIIFCKAGGRSAEAFEIFKDLGFSNVREFKGGFDQFSKKENK